MRLKLCTPQKTSVMPDKLADQLTVEEFRNLLAFLETAQVARCYQTRKTWRRSLRRWIKHGHACMAKRRNQPQLLLVVAPLAA